MLQKQSKYLNPESSQKQNKQSPNIRLTVQQKLIDLIYQKSFQQTLQQLQNKFGIKKIDCKQETYKDLKHYIQNILAYPSTSLAKQHQRSHQLGNYDIVQLQNSLNQTSESKKIISDYEYIKKLEYCPCCGFQKQLYTLKICQASFKDLQAVGISTFMLFRTMINLLFLLLLSLLVFGVYSFATNIKGSNIWRQINQDIFKNVILISLGSKIYLFINQDYNDLLIWQVWLGFCLVVMFMFAYLWMEHIQVKQAQEVQHQAIKVSDYSILIQNVPLQMTKQQIEKEINQYYKIKIKKYKIQANANDQPLKIIKINMCLPANIKNQIKTKQYQSLKYINKLINSDRKIIVSWIRQLQSSTNFIMTQQDRRQVEQNYIKNCQKKNERIKQIIEQVKQSYHDKNQKILTNCFVTFSSTESKSRILKVIQHKPLDKFLHYLTFSIYKKKTKMSFTIKQCKQQYDVAIRQASDPQDIIWQHIGLKTSHLLLRKCVTFFFTGIVLVASFAAVYALSTVQVDNQSNRYISFLISLCIVIFNLIITLVLSIFTVYQLNSSYTDYQSSYAFKAIGAQLINTIIIPILVNRFLKKENYIYTASGLAEDVFLLGLTNAFINPLLKFFDVYYFFTKYLPKLYYDRPSKKMFMTQIELNKIYELMLFESGTQYIYIISLYLWTCFFMSLQPIIIVFSMLGLLLNYWGQKYSLFHLCKRPVPGKKILYDTMVQFVYAGGLFYSLGSLTFINLIPKDIFKTQLNFALIANLLAVGISALSLFIPYSYLYVMCVNKKKEPQNDLYQEERIFFPSEYDRVNPVTRDNALQEYFQYVNTKKSQIHKLDNQEKREQKQFSQKEHGSSYLTNQHQSKNIQFQNNEIKQIYQPYIQTFIPQFLQNPQFIDDKQQINKKDECRKTQIQSSKQSDIVKSQSDNMIINFIKKGVNWFKKGTPQQKQNKNNQNQLSLQRLQNNEIMMNILDRNKKNINQQKQFQQNNIWQLLTNNIQRESIHNNRQLSNLVNYYESQYNHQALQKFKLQSNDLNSASKIKKETGHSYKNTELIQRAQKSNIKQ